MMDALKIEGLTKSFGAHRVLDGLSFSVPEGCVFGFLGQNGAGKTTTMKLILGLLRADAGGVEVCGAPVRYGETKTNRLIGYLPDVPEFYGYMKPREYLRFCGEIAGMSASGIKARADLLIEEVGLSGNERKIGGFSRGMKQRLGIAQALLSEPKLLICDEPTAALDPMGRREILDILGGLRSGTTVVFSTHTLSDAERICDRVAVLKDGKLALEGTLASLRARRKRDGLLVEFANAADLEWCRPALAGAEISGLTATLRSSAILDAEGALIACLARENVRPVRLELIEPTLESLFMEAVQ
jgi:ABC-2 type transport system ATP-binding protein